MKTIEAIDTVEKVVIRSVEASEENIPTVWNEDDPPKPIGFHNPARNAMQRFQSQCTIWNEEEEGRYQARGKPSQPYPSWTYEGIEWVAPVAKPDDGKDYTWDEENQQWM